MGAVNLIIVICWIALAAYWLIAAAGVKSGRSRWGQSIGLRVVIIAVTFFLLQEFGARWHPASSDPWLAGLGLAIFLVGAGLAVWARLSIGRNWGSPMTRKDEPELVTTGPYRRIRHPIYTGLLLAMTGTALAVTLLALIVVAVLAVFFIYSAIREEAFLTKRFPDAYPAYKRSTKMLIPFVL